MVANEVKEWKRLNANSYQLEIEGKIVGEIFISLQNNSFIRSSSFTINGEHYLIENTGPWENAFIIYNKNKEIVLYSVHNNWYNKSFSIQYKQSTLQIIYKSLPKPGWYLIHNHNKILSYSFGSKRDDIIITHYNTDKQFDLLMDFIMFHLIHLNK